MAILKQFIRLKQTVITVAKHFIGSTRPEVQNADLAIRNASFRIE